MLAGFAVDATRDHTRVRAQLRYAEIRHAPFAMPLEAALLPQHRTRAARERVGNVATPIEHFAWIGNKRIAVGDAPAIGFEPRDMQLVEASRVHTSSRTSGA